MCSLEQRRLVDARVRLHRKALQALEGLGPICTYLSGFVSSVSFPTPRPQTRDELNTWNISSFPFSHWAKTKLSWIVL